VERHHVIPKCLGGSNAKENMVALIPEEHYVAHQLLVKMHPRHRGVANAAVLMAERCSGNKAYGWIRRSRATAQRGKKRAPFSREHRENLAAANIGKKHSAESRAKMSEALRHRIRKPHSLEARAKMRAAKLGTKASKETRAKMSAAGMGNKRSLGHKHSPETRAKLSAILRGNKRTLGYIASPETRAKLSIAQLARRKDSHV
jgi:hypothetical protein